MSDEFYTPGEIHGRDVNPNYVPVDWGVELGHKPPEIIDSESTTIPDWRDRAEKMVAEVKDSGISSADLQPLSIDFFTESDPKPVDLAELEGASVVIDGEVVGRVGASSKFPEITGPFKIMPGNPDQPAEIVATLNSAGDTIKIGDTVSHVATKDDRGTVEEIGSALIANTDVPNAVKVRWPSPAGIEDNDTVSWHHVDNLMVIR